MSAQKTPGQAIAEILSGSWRNEPTHVGVGSVDDLPALSKIMASTGAAALAYHRIGSNAADDALKDAAKVQKLTHHLQLRAILSIADTLDQLGVRYLFFKGWVAARAYADPAFRPTGDIDILVEPAAYEKVLQRFWPVEPQPWSPEFGGVINVPIKGVPGGIMLDVHTCLKKHGLDSTETLLNRCMYSPLGGQSLPHLDEASHLRQLCVHGLTHGFWRPLWLCDIAAFVEAREEQVNWDDVCGGDRTIENWVSTCLGLAAELLGADISSAPSALSARRPPVWVVNDIFEAWSKDFDSYHNRADLQYALRNCPWTIPREIRLRWPNTLTAIAQMGWPVPGKRSPLVPLAYLGYRATQLIRK